MTDYFRRPDEPDIFANQAKIADAYADHRARVEADRKRASLGLPASLSTIFYAAHVPLLDVNPPRYFLNRHENFLREVIATCQGIRYTPPPFDELLKKLQLRARALEKGMGISRSINVAAGTSGLTLKDYVEAIPGYGSDFKNKWKELYPTIPLEQACTDCLQDIEMIIAKTSQNNGLKP